MFHCVMEAGEKLQICYLPGLFQHAKAAFCQSPPQAKQDFATPLQAVTV